jgi:hypothetical protein
MTAPAMAMKAGVAMLAAPKVDVPAAAKTADVLGGVAVQTKAVDIASGAAVSGGEVVCQAESSRISFLPKDAPAHILLTAIEQETQVGPCPPRHPPSCVAIVQVYARTKILVAS